MLFKGVPYFKTNPLLFDLHLKNDKSSQNVGEKEIYLNGHNNIFDEDVAVRRSARIAAQQNTYDDFSFVITTN